MSQHGIYCHVLSYLGWCIFFHWSSCDMMKPPDLYQNDGKFSWNMMEIWVCLQTGYPKIHCISTIYALFTPHFPIWRFPEMGVPPVIILIFKDRFSIVSHPAMGLPPWLWKPPYVPVNMVNLGQIPLASQVYVFPSVGDKRDLPILVTAAGGTWSRDPRGGYLWSCFYQNHNI